MSNFLYYKQSDNVKFRYASEGSAGLDVSATQAYKLYPGESALVSTGLHISADFSLPEPLSWAVQVWPRSGLSIKNNIETGAGLIDSDYRGEIKIHLYNHGSQVVDIKEGDYIAQLVFCAVIPPSKISFVEKMELDDTERGEKGFGSSGR